MFQLVLDIEELTKLHQLAERPRIKEILAVEIEKLKKPETALNGVQEASAAVASSSSTPAARATAVVTKSIIVQPKYYKDITTYGMP